MNAGERPALRIGVVAGEESGDLLGADLIAALSAATGRQVELVGIGGRNLKALGLDPLFEGDEIALMGVTAVVRRLPRLLARIRQAADAIVRARPDCLVTIDSPDFALRVAKRVRAADPSIPIVHYVCPSVWAWRPGRAAAMRPYIDHILCLLPFEPAELDRLQGPPGTFVGHRLARHPGVTAAAAVQLGRLPLASDGSKRLLVLPGSRRGEVGALLQPFGETVRLLRRRHGAGVSVAVPTVPHVAPLIEEATKDWGEPVEIVLEETRKWQVFSEADAALACSGTVTLELALSRVPMISCYRTDAFGRFLTRFITAWSASLPNLIADWPVVPEHFNEFVRPVYLAREIERLWAETPTRRAQLGGFEEIAAALVSEKTSGELAADVVLKRARPQ